MSWRDRDYARFRKDEFEAIYGGTGLGSGHTSRTAPRSAARDPA